MSNQPMNDDERLAIRTQLHELLLEHRDLDAAIFQLEQAPPQDELLVRRMKKRKLILKDRIRQLEEMLVPDIPA